MLKLPGWMRVVMLVTAVVNILGSFAFIPSARALREISGLPPFAHPFYLASIGAFILIFGLAYLWAGVTGKADRLFVAVAAAGKFAFFALLVRYWVGGLVPLSAVLSGTGDKVFAALFASWLLSVRSSAAADGRPAD